MTMSDVSCTQKRQIGFTTTETVNHPAHYNHGGAECIDVARGMPFCLGNALKYVWRCGHKHDGTLEGARRKAVEDAKKAVWYLNEFIKDAEAGAMDAYLEV